MSEHTHQVALMQWAAMSESRYPELRWLHAIPNGGQRNVVVAKKLKAEGVKAGVSDLSLPVARHGFHGFYAELKKPKGGKPTKQQSEFIAFLHSQGYHAAVYYGWESIKDAIEWYLSGKETIKAVA